MNSDLKNKSPLPNNNFARIAFAKYDFFGKEKKATGIESTTSHFTCDRSAGFAIDAISLH